MFLLETKITFCISFYKPGGILFGVLLRIPRWLGVGLVKDLSTLEFVINKYLTLFYEFSSQLGSNLVT